MPAALDVLLVEPWFVGSHRAWAEGYRDASDHRVRLITLPGVRWRWRLEASAVTLAPLVDEACRDRRPDVIVVSSMTDVAALVGLARRSLVDVPVVAWRHESQLLYPVAPGQTLARGLALREWASLLAADHVVFNSEHHRRDLLARLAELLEQAPDGRQHERLPEVAVASTVLPIGVDLSAIHDRPRSDGSRPVRLLWNHRWHFDKDPEGFLDAVVTLVGTGVDVRLTMCGADDLPDHRPVERLLRRLGDRVDHSGELPRDAYLRALHDADVVVSTARQECFGVAVVEAIAAGCVPVLPHRLAYPDVVPVRYHDAALHPAGGLVDRLAEVCGDLPAARRACDGLAGEMRRYDWVEVAPRYDALLADVVRGRSSSLPSVG